jgi:1,4-dihydroxy-2-naphthoate octaprenyltransferase
MLQAPVWTRREVWTRKLIYPGHTFPTAIAPIVVSAGLAWHDRLFAAGPLLLAFLAGWLIQFGGVVTDNYTNLVRSPQDREHPELVDAVRRGLLSLADLRAAILGCFSLAGLCGVALVAIAGWPVIAIGLASIAAAWAYSAGPFPFGRHGIADPVFFLFFGTVSVLGSYYVQAASVLGAEHWRAAFSPTATWLSLPIGALITGILIIDDIRDWAFDVGKGKNTIAVRYGRNASRGEFTALMIAAYLAPLWFYLGLGLPALVLLPFFTLPLAAAVTHTVWRKSEYRDLLPMTPRLAMLTVAYAVLLAAGIAL